MKQVSTLNPEFLELHAVVHGHVQGVGFRATVQAHARSMRLNGKVRNCLDGTVETRLATYILAPAHPFIRDVLAGNEAKGLPLASCQTR